MIVALATVVVSLIVLNLALKSVVSHAGSLQEFIATVMYGAWATEALVLGAWVALGFGNWALRFVVTVPCLLQAYIIPQLIRSNYFYLERIDFITIAVAAFLLFAGSIVLFSVLRMQIGLRIEPPGPGFQDKPEFTFSLRVLLAILTLYAVTAAMVSLLSNTPNLSAPVSYEASASVYFFVNNIRSTVVALVLLPTLAFPVCLLRPRTTKRFLGASFAFWGSVTALAVAAFTYAEGQPPTRVLFFTILLQMGSVIVGILAAAPIRLVGCRMGSREATAD